MYAILFDVYVDMPDRAVEHTLVSVPISPFDPLGVRPHIAVSGKIPLDAAIFDSMDKALMAIFAAKKPDFCPGLNTGNWRIVPVDVVMRQEPDHYRLRKQRDIEKEYLSLIAQLPTNPATGETYRYEPKTSLTEKPGA